MSLSSPEWKKSLNTLDLPKPQAEVGFSSMASDVRAVFRTQADSDCIPSIPSERVRFGVASTEGASSLFRIDALGDFTSLDMACGVKLLVIAVPRDPLEASSIRIWSHHDFDVKLVDRRLFRLELVYLRPGDRL